MSHLNVRRYVFCNFDALSTGFSFGNSFPLHFCMSKLQIGTYYYIQSSTPLRLEYRTLHYDEAFVVLISGYPAVTSGVGIQLLCCRFTELEGICKGQVVPALVCIQEQYRKQHHDKEGNKVY